MLDMLESLFIDTQNNAMVTETKMQCNLSMRLTVVLQKKLINHRGEKSYIYVKEINMTFFIFLNILPFVKVTLPLKNKNKCS